MLIERSPDLVLEYAAVSLPADGSSSGGDWWSVVLRPDRRLAVVVGDIMGHGDVAAPAATVVGGAVRAVTEEGHPADTALRVAARSVERLGTTATMIYAVIDLAAGRLRYTSAGHPPPLLVSGRGYNLLPELPSPPLGSGWTGPDSWITTELAPCDTLVLYSDGFAGATGIPGPELTASLSQAAEGGPDRVCRAAMEACPSTGDDRTILAIRMRSDPADTGSNGCGG